MYDCGVSFLSQSIGESYQLRLGLSSAIISASRYFTRHTASRVAQQLGIPPRLYRRWHLIEIGPAIHSSVSFDYSNGGRWVDHKDSAQKFPNRIDINQVLRKTLITYY